MRNRHTETMQLTPIQQTALLQIIVAYMSSDAPQLFMDQTTETYTSTPELLSVVATGLGVGM